MYVCSLQLKSNSHCHVLIRVLSVRRCCAVGPMSMYDLFQNAVKRWQVPHSSFVAMILRSFMRIISDCNINAMMTMLFGNRIVDSMGPKRVGGRVFELLRYQKNHPSKTFLDRISLEVVMRCAILAEYICNTATINVSR